MKKTLLFVSILSILSAGCNKPSPAPSTSSSSMASLYNNILQVDGKTLDVQVTTSPAGMQQGLSGRDKMDDNQGMLFDFGTGANATPGFWMKDMKFDLDFIWIKNDKVVDITPSVPKPAPGTPDKQLPIYFPSSPIDQVLEVNAGWAERNQIKVGDEADLAN